MGNRSEKAFIGASLFLSLAVLAWGIIAYPRFGGIGPKVKPRTGLAAVEDYADTSFRALEAPARAGGETASGGTGKAIGDANAGISPAECFRIIGSSEGDGGKVWFLKGRSSGIVVAAGETAKSGYAFRISEDRASISAAGARYRVEGE